MFNKEKIQDLERKVEHLEWEVGMVEMQRNELIEKLRNHRDDLAERVLMTRLGALPDHLTIDQWHRAKTELPIEAYEFADGMAAAREISSEEGEQQ